MTSIAMFASDTVSTVKFFFYTLAKVWNIWDSREVDFLSAA